MMYDTLCLWFVHCDRKGEDVVIPRAHIEKAIRDAAKAEDRELEKYPWESGKEHERRLSNLQLTIEK